MRRLGPALEVRDFRLWWLASLGMWMSLQMLEVAIGWEVYAQHRSTLDLGWIGLAEFLPMFVLALPAGQLADRVPRRAVFSGALLIGAGVGVGLAVVSGSGDTSVAVYLALAVGAGISMALGTPAARAMPPTLVGAELLASAMTLRSIASQAAQVAGPALGGLLYGISPSLVYALSAGACLAAAGCVLAMRPAAAADAADTAAPAGALPAGHGAARPPADVYGVLEGLRFVGRTQILLGAILLDLLAVLFGGAVALLPVFASSILHVGATGLGLLRAAPAVGALTAAAVITRRPIARHAGRVLLTVVFLYGACIVVFGLSRSYPLSLAALAVSGFVDLYSMNIRSTTVALASPDRLRGRVNAVEMVFISASNQLGYFESGFAAFLVGTVPAVVGGGVATMVIALSWRRLFPDLAAVDRLEQIKPPPTVPVRAS
ncbi:MAG TPA: MFS transporter, partial [Solirubrobacteraceae bacterium]|nr:MFS transporter [Solirubrobacteraceae bacterium]